jgi:hypothetical protein
VVPLVNRRAVYLLSDRVEDPGTDRNGILHLSLVKPRAGKP